MQTQTLCSQKLVSNYFKAFFGMGQYLTSSLDELVPFFWTSNEAIESLELKAQRSKIKSQKSKIKTENSKVKSEVKSEELEVESQNEALWMQAYEFVGSTKQKIIGFARKFLPYSCYSLDEFIQQAYESAYRGFRKYHEKTQNSKVRIEKLREGYFWKQYLKDCWKMTNVTLAAFFTEYREYSEDGAPATTVASSIPDPLETTIQNRETLDNELKELIQKERFKKALLLMTKRERQLWGYLLGCHGKIYSIYELTSVLGLKKSRLIALRNNSLSFIRKTFSVHKHLYTLEELSKETGYSVSTIKVMKRSFFKANEDYIQRTKHNSALFTEKAVEKLKTQNLKVKAKKSKVKNQKLEALSFNF